MASRDLIFRFLGIDAGAGAEFDRMAGKAEATGATLKKLALGAGVVAGIIGVESVRMAASFQSSMTLLQTAGGESAKNMAVVSAGVKKIAVSTGTSLSQVADGMYIVEKAGDRGANGLKVLKAAAEGARAENVDLATATTALTSVMMSYHMSASQATRAENEIVAGAGAAKTSMQNYATALANVLPIASAAHISFAQVAGAIATLTQHGTTAQESTQELANTIRNLQAPSQVAQKAMQQIGIGVNDLERGLGERGLTGTLALIMDKMAASSKAGMVVVSAFKQQASATADLKTELAAMPGPLKQLALQFQSGTIGYQDYYKGIKSLGAAGYEMGMNFRTTMAAAKGFNNLLTSGQPAQRTAAAELKDIMGGATGLNTALMLTGANTKMFTEKTNEVAAAGKKAGANISTWALTSGTLTVKMGQLRAAVEVLMVNLGTKLLPYVSQLAGWLTTKAIPAVSSFAGWVSKLSPQIKILAGVLLAVGAALMFPVTTSIALGVALVVLYNKSQTFRDIVKGAIDVVVVAFRALWTSGEAVFNALAATWRSFADGPVAYVKAQIGVFMTFWNSHFQEIKDVAQSVWAAIRMAVKVEWDMMMAVLKPGLVIIAALFRTGWGVVRDVVETAWNVIAAVIRGDFKVILDIISVALDLLTGHWSKAWTDLKKLVSDALDEIKAVFKAFAGGAIKLLYDAGKNIVGGLIAGIKSMASSAVDAVKNMGSDVLKGAKAIFHIHSPSQDFITMGAQIVEGLAKGIADNGSRAINAAKLLALATVKAARDVAKDVAAAVAPASTNNAVLLSRFAGADTTAGTAQAHALASQAGLAQLTAIGTRQVAVAQKTYDQAVHAYQKYENQLEGAAKTRRTAEERARVAELEAAKQAASSNLTTVKNSVSKSTAAAKAAAAAAATAAKNAIQSATQAAQAMISNLQSKADAMVSKIQAFQGTVTTGLTGDDSLSSIISSLTTTDANGNSVAPTLDQISSALGGVASTAKTFGDQIQQIKDEGGSQDLITQLLGLGPTAGSQLASQLLAAGQTAIKNFTGLYSSISSVVTAQGDQIAQAFYGQGAAAFTQYLQGLESQYPALRKALAPIIKEVDSALGISKSKTNENGTKAKVPSKDDYEAEWTKTEKRAERLLAQVKEDNAKTHTALSKQEEHLASIVTSLLGHSTRNHADLKTLDRDLSTLAADMAKAALVQSRQGAKSGKKT